MNMTNALASGLLASVALASACDAQVIYKWVDDQGRTQASDVVPEKYKAVAERIDASRYTLSPADADAARRSAASLKARADNGAASAPSVAASALAQRRTGAASAAGKAARAISDTAANCAAWRKTFAVSRDCFAGFTLGDGSLRPGAAQACGDDVPNPEPVCGPEHWR